MTKPKQPLGQQEFEKRFLKWVKDRDDDWWENGEGHISIWDIRIMYDFFKTEVDLAKQQGFEEGVRKASGELYNLMDGIIFDPNGQNSEQLKEFKELLETLSATAKKDSK